MGGVKKKKKASLKRIWRRRSKRVIEGVDLRGGRGGLVGWGGERGFEMKERGSRKRRQNVPIHVLQGVEKNIDRFGG